jgi:hypothetical protein
MTEPAGATTRPSGSTSGSSPASPARSHPARDANRASHDPAAETGTGQRWSGRPGTGSRSRAATAATFSPAARSASAAKTTAAAYRRRDNNQAGSSTCVFPQPSRQIPRRGRVSAIPANVATRRGRAQPHGRSVPPHEQTRSPDLNRSSTDSSEPRTVTTVVPPPAPPRRPSPVTRSRSGRAVAYIDTATVAPSTRPRPAHSELGSRRHPQ